MILALFWAPCFAARDSADNNDDDTVDAGSQGEVIVKARRLNESMEDPPVFIDIIDMDQFKGRFITVQEALSQSTGVTVRDFGGLGKLSTMSIRGSTSDQVVVMIDGVRVNPSTGGGVDLSSLPADQVDRIEVIRGGDSAFYGDGAVGGVVNIITKKGKGPGRNTFGASYGSFNTLNTSLSRSQGFEKGSYLAGASYLHTDGNYPYTNDNGTTLDTGDDFNSHRKNNALDDRTLLLKGSYGFSDKVDLSLQNHLHSSIKGVPGVTNFPSPHAWQKNLRNISQASLSLSDLPASGLSFKTTLAHRYEFLQFSDPLGEQTGVPLETEYAENEPRVRQLVRYIWGRHQIWSVSGEYARSILDDKSGVYNDPERDNWATVLSDQAILWKGRITVVPAVRYDKVTDVGDQWSPKIGLSIKPWEWLVVKGNAGRSFRAPNFSELYFNQGFVSGNPDLKPERATNYDGGVQFVSDMFFAEAAYFRNEVEDLIEYLLISGFRYKPFNIGRALLHGMESSATFRPWQYTSLSGSYTLTYAIDKTDDENRADNQIPGIPRKKAFARLEGGPKMVRTFLEYHYIGPNYINQANTKLLNERHILNAGVVVAPSDTFTFGFESKNVLDDQAVDVRGFPLPGRSYFASFELTF